MFDLSQIDHSWTLFLDRDGVINQDKPTSYVFNVAEFAFYAGVLEAMAAFSSLFSRILVITNQRGVGRGLMSESDLQEIHRNMLEQVLRAEGRIDQIYYCTAVNNEDPNRKPNPGMAFKAKADFPEIDLSRSIMVGNKLSDMHFGRNAGMRTIFLTTTERLESGQYLEIDIIFPSLIDFAKALQKK